MAVNMTAQSIAVGNDWVKSGNSYVGDQPSGSTSGGTAALGWSAPSGLSDGNTLTITTDGTYSFGAKSQAAPVLWDFGTEAYENGVFNSDYASISEDSPVPVGVTDLYTSSSNLLVTANRQHRHSNIDRHYYSQSVDCELKNPRAYNTAGANTTMYASWAFRYEVHPNFVRGVGVVSSSGTFTTGSGGSWGEAITATIGSTDYEGRIYSIDGATCTLAVNASINSGTGAISIVGLSSGATASLTTSTDYQALSSTKLFRIVQQSSDGALSVAQISNRQLWVESNTAGVDDIGMGRYTYSPTYGDFADYPKWCHMEVFFDWSSGASISAYLRVDGETESIPAQTAGNILTNQPMRLELFGSDASVSHNGIWFDMGEIYQDTTPQRVSIESGDGSEFELQRITSWSDTTIGLTLNSGAFTDLSGKTYKVWNGTNQVICSGVF